MSRGVTQSESLWRFYLIAFILLAMFSALLARAAYLQVLDTEQGYVFLQNQGDMRAVRTVEMRAHRGKITDRNGEILAMSTPVQSVFVNPRKVSAESRDLQALAAFAGISEAELRAKLDDNSSRSFMYLRRHVAPEEALPLRIKRIAGVGFETEYKRYYPAADVVSQLVGFTNVDDKGQEGVELAYNAWLRGTPGSKQVLKDLNGNVVQEIQEIEAPQPGQDLALSIDLRVQYVAYRELGRAMQAFGAKAGSVVVMDVATGEVLAMANMPSFNPNNRRNLDLAALRNRALIDVFEPGSTIKPLSMVAALESGKFTLASKIDTNPGYVRIEKKVFPDPVNYGVVDLTKIITKSSQVGMSKVALEVGNEAIRDVLLSVGFGQSPGTGFPGEAAGLFPDMKPKPTGVETATLSFGYGFAVSATQLASAYATIASKGIKRPVSILKRSDLAPAQRVMDEQVALQVQSMLATVVKPGGTGTRAVNELYSVAGKTGTAHKAARSGYADSRYAGLFAGLAPLHNPRIAVAVIIDEPSGEAYHGGEVAAPVFSKVAEDTLRLLEETPDLLVGQKAPAMDSTESNGGRV